MVCYDSPGYVAPHVSYYTGLESCGTLSRSPHCGHRGPLYCVYTVIAAIIGPTGVRGTISQETSCFQVNWKYQ